jgi:hypothetical protein
MTQKINHFLALKQQGVHFNEKLSKSSALKNPSLLGKLMTFAGLESDEQYASTLPTELWNPDGFPDWAFKDELGKAQVETVKKREEEIAKGLRPGVEFVKASGEDPGRSEYGYMAKAGGGNAGERVVSGLSRDRERDRGHRRRSRSPRR